MTKMTLARIFFFHGQKAQISSTKKWNLHGQVIVQLKESLSSTSLPESEVANGLGWEKQVGLTKGISELKSDTFLKQVRLLQPDPSRYFHEIPIAIFISLFLYLGV